ncbi:MAG: hypothetical protein ABIK68_05255 [bacterium]
MGYQLKKNQPAIDVVSGQFAGRHFAQGKVYDAIPKEEAWRFEDVKPPQPRKKAEPALKPDPAPVKKAEATEKNKGGSKS